MSPPSSVLPWMILFLVVVAALAAALFGPLRAAFLANPGFNGVILGVLLLGIAINLRQVLRLQREVAWIEAFRRRESDEQPEIHPRLLAPVAQLLKGRKRGQAAISPLSLRSMLDSLATRLEEARDLSRYLIGLLIFLGLLGTFYGLLLTIGAIGDIIGSLNIGADAVSTFATLKTDLQAPLAGMGTAFSTSLFGLAGSLIVGFLDLQSGHAQNRFYDETEEWLSGMTRLVGAGPGSESDASLPAYVQALLEQTADSLDRIQRMLSESGLERQGGLNAMQELNTQLSMLNELLSRESRQLQALSDGQSESQALLAALARQEVPGARLSEELRQELRLLSRTIANAVAKGGHS
jgi:hypothetical protein